jgi:hypothetical protein
MGMAATSEVYGLFAPLLPQIARDEFDTKPARKRQGLVPGLMATCRQTPEAPERRTLLEIKTLHFAPTTYPSVAERCNGVTRRANAVGTEYLRKARGLDQRWLGTTADQRGPVELKLRSFGDVRALVFGAWGEASGDVEWLLNQLAEVGAYRHRSAMEASSPEAAREALIWLLQRRWGMTALKANARLLLERLGHVGRGSSAAADRRSTARAEFGARLRRYVEWASRGPLTRHKWVL